MEKRKRLLSAQDVQNTLKRLSYEILEKNVDTGALCIVGIAGESRHLARELHSTICAIEGSPIPYGEVLLDENRLQGLEALQDRVVILAVDVLFSGNSIRRAMEVICSTGRPHSIQLAALVDRGHRRYPIRANFVGKNIPTSTAEFIEVHLEKDDPQAGVYICEKEMV